MELNRKDIPPSSMLLNNINWSNNLQNKENRKQLFSSSHNRQYSFHRYLILTLGFFNFLQIVIGTPVFVNNPSLAHFQSGRNIRHLPCIVRRTGLEGVCMFAIDCIKANGTHLGTCIDRFYFGSCCQIEDESNLLTQDINDNSIDQNTISHYQYESTTSLPTSLLFKLTTESTLTSSNSVSLSDNNTTSNKIPESTVSVTLTSATLGIQMRPTSKFNSTSKPILEQTKYETQSTSTANLTTTSSTILPTKKYTTTIEPILMTTNVPATTTSNNLVISTTQETKFSTFQIVQSEESTTTTDDYQKPTEVTTIRPTVLSTTQSTKRPTKRPTTQKPSRPQRRTTTTARPTTPTIQNINDRSNVTTTSTRRPLRTTAKKPSTVTTKRSTTTRRPTTTATTRRSTSRTRPTRKPTTVTTVSPSTSILSRRNTTKIDELTLPTTVKTTQSTVTSTVTTKLTASPIQTTKAPRPKPKPTANIVKTTTEGVPTIKINETTILSTSTVSSTIPTTIFMPILTTTERPLPIAADKITATTSIPFDVSSTLGLVTWTNMDELNNITITTTPHENQTEIDDWKPRPPPPDWVPLPTISPDITSIKNDENIRFTTISSIFVNLTTEELIKIPSSTASNLQIIYLNASSTEGIEGLNSTTVSSTSMSSGFPGFVWGSTTSLPELQNVTFSQMNDNTTTPSMVSTSPFPSFEGIDFRQICGKRMFPEPRIVGGANAAFGRWPWQISLRQWRTSTYLHKCGAALLNENWAITAAHCVDNVPPSDLLLRLGEYDLAEEEEPYGYQERRVQIVAAHTQFDPRTFEYDLALLRFYEPVTFQPNIIPVCVPESDDTFIGQNAFVTGWGRLYEDGPLPSVLQEVSVPIINNTICETMYRSAGYIEHIPHIFICAGWQKGGYDSCEGDSGGPLVLQRDDKRFLLSGVISWGIGCAEPNQPGVYTRISEFRDWINQILQF